MEYSGAEIIVKLLERKGIRFIAGIPGGANLPLYEALGQSWIKHILARHEQGAGFIAQGMARSTGKAAVCFATSGPGATNLLTAIADAKLDSVPIVAITGQVPRPLLGTDAFQEVDIYGMSMPVTKHNFLVQRTVDLLEVIPQAFRIAESGRPGPVLIDVPKDVQTERITVDLWPDFDEPADETPTDSFAIQKMSEMIRAAKKPVLYAGGGIVLSGAHESLFHLAKKNSIPVALTLMGLGSFPQDDPLYLGMLGMHGARHTNLAMHESDLLIAVGVRFDDRATGKIAEFCPRAKVIHVDADQAEIGKIRTPDLSICGDAKKVLANLIPMVDVNSRDEWMTRIRTLKEEYRIPTENSPGFQPGKFIQSIAQFFPLDTIVTTDVGQHQMWVAQSYPFRRLRSFLTSGGLGTMGFGLPAAIGAALANPTKRILCVTGDGSILMNLQELDTLAELNLDVTVLILNNGHLGLVRQQQELFYGKKFFASRFETKPDFAGIARAFGIRSMDIPASDIAKLKPFTARRGSSLINVAIPEEQNVYPMVPPGKANHEMIGAEF